MPDVLTGESLALSEQLNDPTLLIVVHLGITTIDIDDAPITLSSITECSFPGYAPIVNPSFDVFEMDDDNVGEAVSDPLRFTANGLVTPQGANVLYITMQRPPGAVKLWQAMPLEVPIMFDVDGRTFGTQVRLRSLPEEVTPMDQGQVV